MTKDMPTKSRGLDHRIPPPLVFLVVAGAMTGAWSLLPPSGLDGPLSWALAGCLVLLAGLTGPPAIQSFRRAGTTINPVAIERASTLVTQGIYRWTRNPMYLAMALLLAAIAAVAAQPALLAGPAAFMLFITRFQIVPEEHAMRARFGAEYDHYRARVRRWI